MTTTIYREFEFAACDSKWSVDGHLRRDVIEKKAIHIDFKGKEAISLMCGDHPMIVLMQAMQLKVITPEQYASLMSLYMDVEDFTFGMVVLDKHSGAILVGMYTPPDDCDKKQTNSLRFRFNWRRICSTLSLLCGKKA
ncbi:hypothetical protein SND05_03290 [Escherichia coli]|nr:hypothetical protein [Escherichia coli]